MQQINEYYNNKISYRVQKILLQKIITTFQKASNATKRLNNNFATDCFVIKIDNNFNKNTNDYNKKHVFVAIKKWVIKKSFALDCFATKYQQFQKKITNYYKKSMCSN